MRTLGQYILQGRLQAIGVISLLTIVSLLLPAFAYLMSGVPVALVTLRQGGATGMQVISGSLLIVLLLTFLINVSPLVALAFAIGIWAPIWLCSMALRITHSQGLHILAAGGLGMLFVVLMYLLVGDVAGWWKIWLDLWVETSFPDGIDEQYLQIFENAVPLMNAMMASGVVLSLIITVLIARWWQSQLFNPGEFKKEFYRLRLPRVLCYPTLVGTLTLLFLKEQEMLILRDLLIVIVFLYLFQGVSTIHRLVSWKGMSQAWLVCMYGFLLLIPQMVLFMACIGMADSWLGERKAFRREE